MLEIVRFLMEQGADLWLTDNFNRTPLHAFIENNTPDEKSLGVLEAILGSIPEEDRRGAYINLVDSSGKTALAAAIIAGDRRQFVARLLSVPGVDVNFVIPPSKSKNENQESNEGLSILHLLVKNGANYESEIRKAINLGADPNKASLNRLSITPALSTSLISIHLLLLGCQEGDGRSVDPNAVDTNGRTLLHKFVNEGEDSICDLIRLWNAGKFNIEIKDKFGKTALHYTSSNSKLMCTRFLLDRGANLESEDRDGNTPLACALLSGVREMPIFLIDRGADINREITVNPQPIQDVDDFANSRRLRKVARRPVIRGRGRFRNLQEMKDKKKKKKERVYSFQEGEHNRQKMRIFEYAISRSMENVVQCMIDTQKLNSEAAIKDAMKHGQLDVVEKLLISCPIANSQIAGNLLNFLFSLPPYPDNQIQKFLQLLQTLIAAKSQSFTDPVDEKGNTLLHLAMVQPYPEDLVNFLLEKGAKDQIQQPNKEKDTPIYLAANQLHSLKILLNCLGAGDVAAPLDDDGNTLLHLVFLSASIQFDLLQEIETIEILIKKGGNPLLPNKAGKTPASLAAKLPPIIASRIHEIFVKFFEKEEDKNQLANEFEKEEKLIDNEQKIKREQKRIRRAEDFENLTKHREKLREIHEKIAEENVSRKQDAKKLKIPRSVFQ